MVCWIWQLGSWMMLCFSKSINLPFIVHWLGYAKLCTSLLKSTCRSSANQNIEQHVEVLYILAEMHGVMGHIMSFVCNSMQIAQDCWVPPLAREQVPSFWIMWPVLVQRTHLKTALMIPVLLTAPIMRMLLYAAALMVRGNICLSCSCTFIGDVTFIN